MHKIAIDEIIGLVEMLGDRQCLNIVADIRRVGIV
jgi:hypothetical protein